MDSGRSRRPHSSSEPGSSLALLPVIEFRQEYRIEVVGDLAEENRCRSDAMATTNEGVPGRDHDRASLLAVVYTGADVGWRLSLTNNTMPVTVGERSIASRYSNGMCSEDRKPDSSVPLTVTSDLLRSVRPDARHLSLRLGIGSGAT